MFEFQRVKIEIFIPCEYVDRLREELSKVSVGKIGNYDNCISVTPVIGYWRPLAGASPYNGEIDKINSGSECKIEVNAHREQVSQALSIIKKIHPYEEPVINIIPLINDIY